MRTSARNARCAFCDPGLFARSVTNVHSRLPLIRTFRNMDAEAQAQAFGNIPEEYRHHFQNAADDAPRRTCANAACQFGTDGQRMRVDTGGSCPWCVAATLATKAGDRRYRPMLVRSFRNMTADAQAEAMDRLPIEHRHHFANVAGRATRCYGRGSPCIFGRNGQRLQTCYRSFRCVFCSADSLQTLCNTASGLQRIATLMTQQSDDAKTVVMEHRLPQDYLAIIKRKLLGLEIARVPSEDLVTNALQAHKKCRWKDYLRVRRYASAAPTEGQRKRFREEVLQNRAYARKKMRVDAPRHPRGAPVDNDSGMPLPVTSIFAKRLYNWNINNSWGMCQVCDSVVPRDLSEKTFTADAPMAVPKHTCSNCSTRKSVPLPTDKDVPQSLRGLSNSQVLALAPLEIHVGHELRANEGGYRIRTGMMRFSWSETSVTSRIADLPLSQRAAALSAYGFLMASPASAYRDFVAEHNDFLRRYPHANPRQRKQRYEFIEKVGLECALWPDLFWDVGLTYTFEKKGQEDDEDDEEHGEDADWTRGSIRKRFCALALGPLLGYADSFEKVQFVYDLLLWTEIGQKRNVANAPLRIMMAGHSMSPEYWISIKFALVDMVRQMGWPLAMITQSMREEMFPYPHWVCDAMDKACRSRVMLPVAETLATTHSLIQTIKGSILGQTAPRNIWQSHLLAPICAENFGVFNRVEFQDGSRKAPTQDYHGSGRAHTHSVIFGAKEDFKHLPLPVVLSASPVASDLVEGYCQAVQLDTRSKKSGWPRRDEESCWLEDGSLRLHHDAASHSQGRRACFPDVMEALPLHQDVQVADDREGCMRAYLAKYSAKISDGLITDLLSDDGPVHHVAMAFVDRYHPAEPEMILQLFGRKFRQWHLSTISGGKRDFIPPVPDAETLNAEVKLYLEAPWARGHIPLIDFMRKTGSKGQILHWLKKKHSAAAVDEDLASFARSYKMRGEKVVAAKTLSWFNDRFYGQWLMLHVPFDDPKDFVDEEILSKVPKEMRYFAMALNCDHVLARATWGDEDAIHTELKLEGHSSRYATSVLNMCRANKSLVQDYISGTLNLAAEVEARHAREAELRASFVGGTDRQCQHLENMFSAPAIERKEVRLPIFPEYEEAIASGTKDVEGRINKGVAASVREGDICAFGRVRRCVLAVHHFDSFRDMLSDLSYLRALPGATSMTHAVRTYHSFRNYEALAREHGVVAFELGDVPEADAVVDDASFPWTPQQRMANARLDEFLDLAIDAAHHPDEDCAIAAKEKLWEENKIVVILGPPGSGKTTVQKRLILQNHAKGGRAFYALPNNALAARMRDLCGSIIQTGTCHSILGLDEPPLYWPSLDLWQLGLIDEISQLNDNHYQQIAKMFELAEKSLVLLMAGDKWQISGHGETRVWHSNPFRDPRTTVVIEFPQMHRCRDPLLASILHELRTQYPSDETLERLRSPEMMAWYPVGEPTAGGMRRLFAQHPDTHVLVCSRKGAEKVNEAALLAMFPRFPPRAVVPGDVASYSGNYEYGEMLPTNLLRPSEFPIFVGMKAFITRTLRKDLDFVNGMEVTVKAWSQQNEAIRVETKTGRVFDVTKFADPDFDGLPYYPLRIGYASTILRMAGAELQHVTVYLDAPHVGAAAYTALSRVARLDCIKIGGKITRDHFAPAHV